MQLCDLFATVFLPHPLHLLLLPPSPLIFPLALLCDQVVYLTPNLKPRPPPFLPSPLSTVAAAPSGGLAQRLASPLTLFDTRLWGRGRQGMLTRAAAKYILYLYTVPYTHI
jgi:hypothetical protein